MVNTYLVLFVSVFADTARRVPTTSFMFSGRNVLRPYKVWFIYLFWYAILA